jgi:shikimate kinase
MPRPSNPGKKTIVLVGLMGSGKSSIGRRLARRLRLPFADADEEIEAAAGLKVAEIFERHGEAHFREGEQRVIARLIEGPRKVVATGGGAFVDAGTRAAILASCIAIWLDADVEILAERVNRRDSRPLLRGRDARDVLRDLAEARNPIYAEAHLRIASGDVAHEAIVETIVGALPAL